MNMLLSVCVPMFSLTAGSQKLGHPEPESNWVSEEKSGAPQQTQL
jgi:hypothetical protein